MSTIMQPTSVIKARLGVNPNGPVQRFFQDTCYKKMNKYVPKDNGDLRNTVDLSNPNYIVYEMPYALYQYKGIREDGSHQVHNYTTLGTGPYWDKRMWSAEGEIVLKQVEEYIRRKHG